MSWPQWPGGQPGIVQPPVINPAPNVVNPSANQYTPEQWAQMQHQNWQQWAQWQQQFQQWQQQYGAEYQKSMNAIAQASMPPQVSVPFVPAPPLPAENKPPPPPDEPVGPPSQSTNAPFAMNMPPPSASQSNYNTAPPPPHPPNMKPGFDNKYSTYRNNAGPPSQGAFPNQDINNQQRFPRNQNYNARDIQGQNTNWHNQNRNQQGMNRYNQPLPRGPQFENKPESGTKRPYFNPNDSDNTKRNKVDLNEGNKWGGNQQQQHKREEPLKGPPQQKPPTVAQAKSNPEELSEAEKKFDKQFNDWEAQFQKWKEQNANHPDKEQYRQYEKKWETWRAQLLERREQMKRKRLGLSTTSPQQQSVPNKPDQEQLTKNVTQSPGVSNTNTEAAPSTVNALTSSKPETVEKLEIGNDVPAIRPPPNLNNQPLEFKKSSINIIESSDQEKENNTDILKSDDEHNDFLKSTASDGIPGLDLVKEDDNTQEVDVDSKKNENTKPDLEAISRGINSILGDQKLLNMLSLVSQNQTKAQQPPPKMDSPKFSPAEYVQEENDYSNEEHDEYFNFERPSSHDETPANLARSDSQKDVENDYYHEEGSNSFEDSANFSEGPDNLHQFSGSGPRNLDKQNFNRSQNYMQDPNRDANSFNRGPGNTNFGNSAIFNRMGDNYDQTDRDFDNLSRGNFNKSRNPPNFGREPNQFNRGSDNFSKEADDFNRAPNNFNKGPDGFNRGSDNFNNFNRGLRNTDNYNRGPDNFNRGPDNFNRGPDNFNRGPDNFNRGPDNFNRGPDNFTRGPGNFNRGPDNFNRRSDNFNRGPDNFNRNPVNFRGHDNFNRGPDNFNRGPVGFNRGTDNFNRGHESFNRGPDNFNRGSENFSRPSDAFSRGPVNFRGSDNFSRGNDRGPDDISKGGDDLSKGPNTFKSDPDDFKSDPDNFKSEPDNFDEESENFGDADNFDEDADTFNRDEPEIILEVYYTFDYRHKPLNRIPYPSRPKWLSEMVEKYPEFGVGRNARHDSRKYPSNEKFDTYNMYDDRSKIPYDDWSRRTVGDRDKYTDRDRKFNEDRKRKSYDNREHHIYEEKERHVKEYRSDKNRRIFDREGGVFNEEKDKAFEESGKSHNFDEQKSTDSKVSFSKGDHFDDEDDFENEDNFSSNSKHSESVNVGSDKQNKPKHANKNNTTPSAAAKSSITSIEDILTPPGRYNRPPRIVIILRGPPGSGKSFLAKLIKDKEVENGGSAPRILCLDDYFMVEQEKEVEEDGRKTKIKEMVYEYEEDMEASYRQSLMKSFKKTITDGYFTFIIVDNVNDKVKYFGEMWSFAKQNGFQVYISQMELDVQNCTKRNIHGRTETEIEKCVAGWEQTPAHHPVLDATNLIQSGSIPEVEMEEINSPSSDNMNEEDRLISSKWDTFDYSVDNLAKLDGTNKPLRTSRTMEDYLQLDDDWIQPVSTKPGQKRVRWADLEERKEQEKMRAIGFVVGQTNWDRMMDPTMGGSALTQTKYIERYSKY
ncbi:hypothetical protein RI129_007498 [Pyrocoelia pectoralis]|uniref:YLP motif-containing protein 1 n=1 Tax=Pyrocoelia pectoralis TaxID=417401 RepID=A0AAN7VE68_9COLE